MSTAGRAARPSAVDRIRSAYHGWWLAVSERLAFGRGAVRERAVGSLPALSAGQREGVAALNARYPVRFEAMRAPDTALRNYDMLHWLDAAFCRWNAAPAQGGRLHDVGCASFWYAPVLRAFFAPTSMVGVEIEGHRLLAGWRSRRDHVEGHVADLPGASFLVADYRDVAQPVQVITAFFPFVTPGPVLAWRMPLSVLAPAALFARVAANLEPAGQFVMVNHGEQEAAVASAMADDAGLRSLGPATIVETLLPRPQPPVATLWGPPDSGE